MSISPVTGYFSVGHRVPAAAAGAVLALWGVTALALRMVRAKDRMQAKHGEELTRLIHSANAPIFGTDTEGRIVEWNRKAAEITGYSRDEVVGHSLVDEFIAEDFKESVRTVLERAIHGDEESNYELLLRTKDRRQLTLLFSATTRRDTSERITGVLGVGQDITERVEAARERERFLAEKVDLVKRLLESQEEERTSIAYDLHDGPAQQLSGASMFIESYIANKDALSGFPGIWTYCVELGEAFTKAEIELKAVSGETYEWIQAIDSFVRVAMIADIMGEQDAIANAKEIIKEETYK